MSDKIDKFITAAEGGGKTSQIDKFISTASPAAIRPATFTSPIQLQDYSQLDRIRLEDGVDALNKRRALEQSTLDQFGNTLAKSTLGIGLGIIENIGYLTEIPGVIMGNDRDYSNELIEIAREGREGLDEAFPVYRENPNEVFDLRDPAWWMQHGGGLVESIGEFAITGGGIAKVLGLAGKLGKAGAVGQALGRAASQGVTAGSLSFVEGAMSGNQIYKDMIAKGKSPEEAAIAATQAVKINTGINTFLNLTGVGALFRTPAVSRSIRKGIFQETREQYLGRLRNQLDDINAKVDGGKTPSAILGLLGESVQESAEEVVNVIAEQEGRFLGGIAEEGTSENLGTRIRDAVTSDEGMLSAILGAAGGVGQQGVINLATRKRRNREEQEQLAFDKQRLENLITAVEDTQALSTQLQQQMADGDLAEAEITREKLFYPTLSHHVKRGTSDALVGTFKDVQNVDNTQDLGETFNEPIAEAYQRLQEVRQDPSLSEEARAEQVQALESTIQQLNQRRTELSGVTEAMRQGLAISPNDNEYKRIAGEKLAQVQKSQQDYIRLAKKYNTTDLAKQMDLAGAIFDYQIAADDAEKSSSIANENLREAEKAITDYTVDSTVGQKFKVDQELQALRELKRKYEKGNFTDSELRSSFNTTDRKQVRSLLPRRIAEIDAQIKRKVEEREGLKASIDRTVAKAQLPKEVQDRESKRGYKAAYKDAFEKEATSGEATRALAEVETEAIEREKLFREKEKEIEKEVENQQKVDDEIAKDYRQMVREIKKNLELLDRNTLSETDAIIYDQLQNVSENDEDLPDKLDLAAGLLRRNKQTQPTPEATQEPVGEPEVDPMAILEAMEAQDAAEQADEPPSREETPPLPTEEPPTDAPTANVAGIDFGAQPEIGAEDVISEQPTDFDVADVTPAPEPEPEPESSEELTGDVSDDKQPPVPPYTESRNFEDNPSDGISEIAPLEPAYTPTNKFKPYDIDEDGYFVTKSNKIEDTYPTILFTDKLRTDTPLIVRIDEDFVDPKDSTNTYENFKDDVDNVPIVVTTTDGQVVGYIRRVEKITPERVAQTQSIDGNVIDNVAYQKALLREMREFLMENREFPSTVKLLTGNSALSTNLGKTGLKPVAEAIPNTGYEWGTVKTDGITTKSGVIDTRNTPEFISNNQGSTVIIPDPNGREPVGIPVSKPRMTFDQATVIADIIDHFYNKNNNKLQALYDENDVSISTVDELIEYLNNYIRIDNLTKEDRKLIQQNPGGNADAGFIAIYDDNVVIQRYDSQAEVIPKQSLRERKDALIDHIQLIYHNHNSASNGTTVDRITKENDQYSYENVDYDAHLSENFNTNLFENEVEYQGKKHYSVFDNPTFELTVPYVSKINPLSYPVKPSVERVAEREKKESEQVAEEIKEQRVEKKPIEKPETKGDTVEAQQLENLKREAKADTALTMEMAGFTQPEIDEKLKEVEAYWDREIAKANGEDVEPIERAQDGEGIEQPFESDEEVSTDDNVDVIDSFNQIPDDFMEDEDDSPYDDEDNAKFNPTISEEGDQRDRLVKAFAGRTDVPTGLVADTVNLVQHLALKNILKTQRLEKQPNPFDSVKNFFETRRDRAKQLRDKTGNDSGYQALNHIVEEFDFYMNRANRSLLKLGIEVRDDLVDVTNEDANYERVKYDDSSIFGRDNKFQASTSFKRFMSLVYDLDSNRERKKILNLGYKYVPVDVVFNKLKSVLADVGPVYEDMIDALKANVKYTPWLQDVINKLEEPQKHSKLTTKDEIETLRNEFVTTMSLVKNNFKIFLFNEEEPGVTTSRIQDTDNYSSFKAILKNWREQIKNTKLAVQTSDGWRINQEELKALAARLDETRKQLAAKKLTFIDRGRATEDGVKFIKEFTTDMGMELSDATIVDMLENRVKDVNAKTLFTKEGILARLVMASNKARSKVDDDFELDNPLFDNSTVIALAEAEAANSDSVQSSSTLNVHNDNIVTINMDRPIYKRLRKLMGTDYAKTLANLPFFKKRRSDTWLSRMASGEAEFRKKFAIELVDGLRRQFSDERGKTLGEMTRREREGMKLMAYLNKADEAGRYARFIHTVAGKSTSFMFKAPKVTEARDKPITFKDGKLSKNGMDAMLSVIESEIARINQQRIEGYQEDSQFKFYFFDGLNEMGLIKGSEEGGYSVDVTDWAAIKDYVNSQMASQIEAKRQTYLENQMIQEKQIKGETVQTLAFTNNQRLTDDFLADYLVNQSWFQFNMMQTFIGDPAQFYKKPKSGESLTEIESTWDNIFKRVTKDQAPAINITDDVKNKDYLLVHLADAFVASDNLEGLSEEDKKVYQRIESTDAQEYTTVAEHLYLLKQMGRLSPNQYTEILAKVNSGEDLGDEIKAGIFNPIKPVFVGKRLQQKDGQAIHEVTDYIKSSSFPLVPQLTKGTSLDNLRVAMEELSEANGDMFVRAAFGTATKLGGAPSKAEVYNSETKKFNPNISFTYGDVDSSKDNVIKVSRSGLGIQQEVPYKEGVNKVTDGSQQRKLIQLILATEGNEELDKKEVLRKYNNIYKRLYEKSANALEKELYTNGEFNIEKFRKLLIEEAEVRGWSENDIRLLDTYEGEFVVPLWFNSSNTRIESLLQSIVNNRILKRKRQGGSFVLASQEGFDGFSNSIIYSDSYDPGGLQGAREAKELTTLNKLKEELVFQGTPVEFVDVIPTDRKDPVSFRNVNKGEKFLFVEKLFKQRYEEKAWTDPKELNDGSRAQPLTEDAFSTFDEFLTFALLHEKAHETFIKQPNETIGQYEDRINREAMRKLNKEYGAGRKPAQIFIPNKLGIDIPTKLRKVKNPVTGQLQVIKVIDHDKLPASFLEGFGYRIPTQSYSSMAHVEIVGFLPDWMGDMVVAPRDFVTQMGSDFDIDKLNVFFYELEQKIDSEKLIQAFFNDQPSMETQMALMSMITETEEYQGLEDHVVLNKVRNKVKAGGVESLTTKEAILWSEWQEYKNQNISKYATDNIRRVENPNNALLDIDLEIMSTKEAYDIMRKPLTTHNLKRIIKKYNLTKPRKLNKLHDDYFNDKYDESTVGAVAIGRFATLSTIMSLAAQVDADENGQQVAFNSKLGFRDKKGEINEETRNISNPYTLDGNLKAKVVEEFLSAAVDNEKDPILGALGVNNDTMSVVEAMIAIGYEAETIARFINQPAVKAFVKNYSLIMNSSARFGVDPVTEAINMSIPDMPSKQQEQLEKWDKAGRPIQNSYMDSINSESPSAQLYAILHFISLDNAGSQLSQLKQAYNVEHAMLPKTILESISKLDKVNDIMESPVLINADKIGYDISEEARESTNSFEDKVRMGEIQPNSLAGYGIEYGLKVADQIATTLGFPYKSDTMDAIYSAVSAMKGNLTDKDKQDIFNEHKNFVFASAGQTMLSESPSQARHRLMTDVNSLATRIERAKRDYNNAFLRLLDTRAGAGDQVSVIEANNLAQVGIDEEFIHQGFRDLFTNPLTYDLAKDLVIYSFLNNANTHPKSYSRFIPPEAYDIFGIAEGLRNYDYRGNTSPKDFIQQLVQNNPKYANRVDPTQSVQVDQDSIETEGGIIRSYTMGLPQFLSDENEPIYSDYNSYYDAKNYKWRLYKHVGEGQYRMINTMGGVNTPKMKAQREYTSHELNQLSVYPANRIGISNKKPVREENLRYTTPIDVEPSMGDGTFAPYLPKYRVGSVAEFAASIEKHGSPSQRVLAKLLKPFGSNVTIAIRNDLTIQGAYDKGMITLSGSLSEDAFIETGLHEMLHMAIEESWNSPDSEEKRKLIAGIDGLRDNAYKKVAASLDKDVVANFEEKVKDKNRLRDEGLTVEEQKLYQTYDIEEFIIASFTNKGFQKFLKDEKFTKNKTLIERLADIIKEFLGALNTELDADVVGTTLERVIQDTIELLDVTTDNLKQPNNTGLTLDPVEQAMINNEPSIDLVEQSLLQDQGYIDLIEQEMMRQDDSGPDIEAIELAMQREDAEKFSRVVKKSQGELGTMGIYTNEGVNTVRKSGNRHFGNPFSGTKAVYEANDKIIPVASEDVATQEYEKWLRGKDHKDVNPDQRAWILKQIKEGRLNFVPILDSNKRTDRTHANVLEDLSNERASNDNLTKFMPNVIERSILDRRMELAKLGTGLVDSNDNPRLYPKSEHEVLMRKLNQLEREKGTDAYVHVLREKDGKYYIDLVSNVSTTMNFMPETRDTRIMNELMNDLEFLNKRIYNEQEGEGKNKLIEARNALKIEIDKHGDRINMKQGVELGQAQLDRVMNILAQPTITEEELTYTIRTIYLWKDIGTTLLDEGAMEDEDYRNREDVKAVGDLQQRAQESLSVWLSLSRKYFTSLVQSLPSEGDSFKYSTQKSIFGTGAGTDNIEADIGDVAAQTLDTSRTDSAIISAIDALIRNSTTSAENAFKKDAIDIDKIFDSFKKTAFFKKHGYDIFFERKEGKKTGNLVNRTMPEYYEKEIKLRQAYQEARDLNKPQHIQDALFKKFVDFKDANNIYIDVNKLFTFDPNTRKFNFTDDIGYRSKLVNELGELRANDAIEATKKRMKAYEKAYNKCIEDIANMSEDEKKGKSDQQLLEEWINKNSPFRFLKNKQTGNKYVKSLGVAYTYNAKIPEWNNEQWDEIAKDKEAKLFLDWYQKRMRDFYNTAPDHIVREVSYNFLPTVPQGLLDEIAKKGLLKTDVLKHFNELVVDKTYWLNKNRGQYRYAKAVEYHLEPTFLQERKDTLDEREKAVQASTQDLQEIMKITSKSSLLYKYKSDVEDKVKLGRALFEHQKELKRERKKGELLERDTGTGGLSNKKAMLDYGIAKNFYNQTPEDKHNYLLMGKHITRKNRKEQKRLLKLLENTTLETEKEEIRKQLNELGAPVTLRSSARFFMGLTQLRGMAYGVMGALNNQIFGTMMNYVHSKGRQDFNEKDFRFAVGKMKHAMSGQLPGAILGAGIGTLIAPGLGTIVGAGLGSLITTKATTGPEAKKIRNLMNHFNAMGDFLDINDYKRDFYNTQRKWYDPKNFAPYELQRKSEYYAYGITLLSMLNSKKVTVKENGTEKKISLYDAYNENGEIRDDIEIIEGWDETAGDETSNSYLSLKNKIDRVNKTIHGNYDPKSQTRMRGSVVGGLVMQFRGWLPEGFAARFEQEKFDRTLGRDIEGRYRMFNPTEKKGWNNIATLLKRTVLIGRNRTADSYGYTELQYANLRMAVTEMQLSLMLAAIGLAFKYMADDEDDEDSVKRIGALYALNVFNRTRGDIAFFANPMSGVNTADQLVPSFKYLKDMQRTSYYMYKVLFDEDADEQTTNALVNNTLKLTPFSGPASAVKAGREAFGQ